MLTRCLAALLALVLLALLPATATAGTASVTPPQDLGCHKGFCDVRPGSVTFAAAAGEANAVTLTEDGGSYTFRDTGAGLTAGDGCTQVDAQTAQCGSPSTYVEVALGDGDDRVVAQRPDCELGDVAFSPQPGTALSVRPLRVTARSIVYGVTCVQRVSSCHADVEIRTTGRRPVRLARFRGPLPRTATRLTMRLTRAGRRLLRRSCPRIEVTLRGSGDGNGNGWVVPKRGAGLPARPVWCRRG